MLAAFSCLLSVITFVEEEKKKQNKQTCKYREDSYCLRLVKRYRLFSLQAASPNITVYKMAKLFYHMKRVSDLESCYNKPLKKIKAV